MKLRYNVVDVFTDRPLAGNPLTIVLDADELSQERMQAIAAEFGHSETAFICKPRSLHHSAFVKIFTPRVELPFSGHSTVGAAVAVGLRERASGVRLEQHLGAITVVVERLSSRAGFARFALPRLPERQNWSPDAERIAEALSISAADIGCEGFEPAVYSAGVSYYLVPVRNSGVLAAIKPRFRGWFDLFSEGINAVYAFTRVPEEKGVEFGARMFTPDTREDPATGSAAGAFVGLLAGQPDYADGNFDLSLRQGREMGRPSVITLQLRTTGGRLTHAGIGGRALIIAEGVMTLDE